MFLSSLKQWMHSSRRLLLLRHCRQTTLLLWRGRDDGRLVAVNQRDGVAVLHEGEQAGRFGSPHDWQRRVADEETHTACRHGRFLTIL